MQEESHYKAMESRIAQLNDHLNEIKRNMEKLISENRRMREVVRLAERELRKRRDQVEKLEKELNSMNNNRLEARARVDHAIEKLDEILHHSGDASS